MKRMCERIMSQIKSKTDGRAFLQLRMKTDGTPEGDGVPPAWKEHADLQEVSRNGVHPRHYPHSNSNEQKSPCSDKPDFVTQ